MSGAYFAQVMTALGVIATAVATILTHRKVNETAVNVQKIEIATNSMKDALVASTAKASHAEGVEEGKAIEKANPK